jgi:hypothetical protein
MRADGTGRLSLPVTLGPGNPYQEYSPQASAWLATRHLTDGSGHVLESTQTWPVYAAVVAVSAARR